MRIKVWCVIALICLVFSACAVDVGTDEPGDEYALVEVDSPLIFYHGRTDMRDPKAPKFDWAASGFSVRFTGASIGAIIDDSGENDFSVFVDGEMYRRISASAGEQRIYLARGLQRGEHRLDFYKSTESDQGVTALKGLLLAPDSDLLPPEASGFRIQVFGDSVSAGYGTAADAYVEGWHREHADACQAWPFFAARALDAELTLTAASGRGILRNYGEPGPLSKVPFTALAWRVLLDDGEWLAPDTDPAPDVVIVCLGHNDMSPGYTLGEDTFREGYMVFLEGIRSRWPDTPILCGSLEQEPLSGWLAKIVDEKREEGDAGLHWYAFSRSPWDECGDDYHPNARAQARFAEEILPMITEVTGREPVR